MGIKASVQREARRSTSGSRCGLLPKKGSVNAVIKTRLSLSGRTPETGALGLPGGGPSAQRAESASVSSGPRVAHGEEEGKDQGGLVILQGGHCAERPKAAGATARTLNLGEETSLYPTPAGLSPTEPPT